MKSTFLNPCSLPAKNLLLLALFSLAFHNAQAQWQAFTPTMPDTVGAFDLRIAHGNDQVAWCVQMKYNVTPSAFEWLPMDNLVFSKTSDGGNTWTGGTIPMGPEPYASNICPISANTAWASGLDLDFVNYVLRTDDGGVTWTRQLEDKFAEATSYVDFVHFWDANNGVAMGDPAVSDTDTIPFYEIYTTTDGGTSWTRVPSSNIPLPIPGEFGSSGYYEVAGDYVWFGSLESENFSSKRLYRSKDRGYHWEELPATEDLVGIFSFADSLHGINLKRISPNVVKVHYTTDGGDTWTERPSLFGADFTSSAVLIPNSLYILAVRRSNNVTGPFKTILSKDLGQTWIELGVTEHAAPMKFSSPTTGYAGEWQSTTHATRMYKYAGSPLSGLLSGQTLNAAITVSPNPTTDVANLHITVAEPAAFTLLLHDGSGKLIERQELEKTADGTARFELQQLPAGLYTLTVSSDKGFLTRSIVKQ